MTDKKDILIIEDSPAVGILLREYLERLDYHKIHTCGDGDSGIKKFKELVKPNNLPIVFLDYNLPDMNAFSVITQLLYIRPETKVIIETVSERSEEGIITTNATEIPDSPIATTNSTEVIDPPSDSLEMNGEEFVSVAEEELNSEINQISISAWIKPDFTKGSPEFAVVSKENSFVLSVNSLVEPQKTAKFSVFDSIAWNTITGTTELSSEKWYHLVGIVDETTLYLYVDGKLEDQVSLQRMAEIFAISEGAVDCTACGISTSDSDVIIGAYVNSLGDSSNKFSGEIIDLKIYKNALTQDQITQVYSDGLIFSRVSYT